MGEPKSGTNHPSVMQLWPRNGTRWSHRLCEHLLEQPQVEDIHAAVVVQVCVTEVSIPVAVAVVLGGIALQTAGVL